MMTLSNWLRKVFAQKTSNLESTTEYRTTKEGFGIYPTRNKSLIFILRTTPHPFQCFRANKIRRFANRYRISPQERPSYCRPPTPHFRCIGECIGGYI